MYRYFIYNKEFLWQLKDPITSFNKRKVYCLCLTEKYSKEHCVGSKYLLGSITKAPQDTLLPLNNSFEECNEKLIPLLLDKGLINTISSKGYDLIKKAIMASI